MAGDAARLTVKALALPFLAALALAALLGGGTVAVVTTLRRSKFLAAIADEVARQLGELRPDLSDDARALAARIVAAQAGHETGYGRTIAWREGFNFGNITAGSSWSGPVVEGGDTEPDASGRYVPITQRFRKYGSLAEAVSDYFSFLSLSRYRPARDALFAGDLARFAELLHAGGYFTAPVDSYIAGMQAAFEKVGAPA